MVETATANKTTLLKEYKNDVQQELNNILSFWMKHCADEERGGFYGRLNNDNIADTTAPKGVVLNARILWTFSAAMQFKPGANYATIAERAFNYVLNHFYDKEYGGVYWTVDADGKPLNTRKQMYALAFAIYGLSEYYAATQNKAALNTAITLFNTVEEHSYDKTYRGYFEAFSRQWGVLDDLRLSAKDANEKKTMNTHLHIIEAYCNLYKVWPDEGLKAQIVSLLQLFDKHIINKLSGHLDLFFDEQWNVRPNVISYGHDIEAAWLLQECAAITGDKYWIDIFKAHAVTIATAAAEGLDADGGLWYEYKPDQNLLVKEKHWWPQAEAMIGFFNAWQITGDEKFLQQSFNSWVFTKHYIVDKKWGEWFWGITGDNNIMQGQDKAGFWKCPYHNARACMELIKRIDESLK